MFDRKRVHRSFRPLVEGMPLRIAPTVYAPTPPSESDRSTSPCTSDPTATPSDSMQSLSPTTTC